MIISLENKYIFIAVPKTGTSSIQEFLLKNDQTAFKNFIEIEGRKFLFKEHMTAYEIKCILDKHYQEFRVFGFMRDPYSKLISSYFFYKNGKPITKGNQNPWPARIRILYAKITPFKIWALIYPYNSIKKYFIDERSRVIVDYIGNFSTLKQDFSKILAKLNLTFDIESLPHENKSTHLSEQVYFKNKIFKNLVTRKIHMDIKFYEKHSNKII